MTDGRAREDEIRPFNPAEVAATLGRGAGPVKVFDTYLVTGGDGRAAVTEVRTRHGDGSWRRIEARIRLGVTAEGIEQPAQVAALRALGCTVGQGYLFARPMPDTDFRAFLARTSERRSITA